MFRVATPKGRKTGGGVPDAGRAVPRYPVPLVAGEKALAQVFINAEHQTAAGMSSSPGVETEAGSVADLRRHRRRGGFPRAMIGEHALAFGRGGRTVGR